MNWNLYWKVDQRELCALNKNTAQIIITKLIIAQACYICATSTLHKL
jgi:hypothetical protein